MAGVRGSGEGRAQALTDRMCAPTLSVTTWLRPSSRAIARRPPLPHAQPAATLARITAARIERMARQVQDDLEHRRPVSVSRRDLGMAILVLTEELQAIEIAAKGAAAA